MSFGFPSFTMVGLPDASVRESRDRVRSAIESNELASRATMHDRGIDPRPRRRVVDRSHRDLAPRTASDQHHAVDDNRGRRLVGGIGDRRLREHADGTPLDPADTDTPHSAATA